MFESGCLKQINVSLILFFFFSLQPENNNNIVNSNDDDRNNNNKSETMEGIVVSKVMAGSSAQRKGLLIHDQIVKVCFMCRTSILYPKQCKANIM